jgi:hypothetical protein
VITTRDLLAPVGPLEYAFFPEEEADPVDEQPPRDPPRTKLEVRLQVYIDQGYEKINGVVLADPDKAVVAWSLHRAFEAALLLMSARPNSEDDQVEVLGSRSFAKDQRDDFRERSRTYLAEFEDMQMKTARRLQPTTPQSRSVHTVYDF